MSLPSRTTLRGVADGKCIGVVGDKYRFLVTGAETEGKYAQWEATIFPGGGPPPHVHRREEEGFYILEGEITFYAGEEEILATAGMFVNMPIGSLHAFKNNTSSVARMLITVAPAGIEEMFFEVGQPLSTDQTPSAPSQEEIAKLLEIAPRYGIEIHLPH